MYYTYILKSNKDGKFYTGATSDLRKRLEEHNRNEVRTTKGRGPFEIIYYEACKNEHDAFIREKYLKSGQGKRFLKNRIKRFLFLTGQAPLERSRPKATVSSSGVYPVRSKSSKMTVSSNGVYPVKSKSPKATVTFNGGFVTLEILIAMMIILLALGATMLVASGNDSILVDNQVNAEALTVTQKTLENEQALARTDFKLVNSTTTTETVENTLYTKKVVIATQPDFFTKRIAATISWPGTFGRSPSVTLTALITNFERAVGGDTCDSNLSLNWKNPAIKSTFNNLDTITAIDTYKGKLYLTTNNSSANNPTFSVFNINSDQSLSLLNQIDNDPNNTGLNALAIATSSLGSYAYVASASSFVRGQMQIIDVGLNPPQVIKTFKIATTTVAGSSTQGIGNSIFYKDGYIYLGLTKTANNSGDGGAEFNIIDVHNNANPFWVSSFDIKNTINSIVVRRNYAYLATPNSNELIVLDVSSPSNPVQVGAYDAPGGSGNGKNLYIIGDNLYLGRTLGGDEFYALNIATTTPTLLGSKNINSSINGLIVRDYLAFLLTNSQLQIWDIGNSANIVSYTAGLNLPGSNTGASMDCEGNNIFVGANNPSGKGSIFVIAP